MSKAFLLIALLLTAVAIPTEAALTTPISKATASTLCKGGWTGHKRSVCAWCAKGVLGVSRCDVIRCGSTGCNHTEVPRGSSMSAVRISLSQCIGNYNRCASICAAGSLLPPPSGGLSDLEYKQCLNLCDANHAACVDRAMNLRYLR